MKYVWTFVATKLLAERGFDPRTSGLWAQHASTAPLCCRARSDPVSLAHRPTSTGLLELLASP